MMVMMMVMVGEEVSLFSTGGGGSGDFLFDT